ncbi:RHS repeat-associated core domain-containing protein [Acinetobacter sp. 1124_18A]|uniref:RHS repeat-associated core domain-containing protein n=1 Tax=Acinetobacter sp. 1124_18A TaxID=2605958 RepID=UPI004058B50E
MHFVHYYGEFTGLHYNSNRYYNPELGYYIGPDPIGLEGRVNPYVYADNNSLTHVDSSGLDSYNFSFFEAYKGDSAYKASLFEEWGLRSFNLPDLY